LAAASSIGHELAEAGVHRHRQAGISGSASKGADSIVVSGGYEDDQDFGDLIIYTGYGGRDPATGRQVSDQPFSSWNRALAYSGLNGLPVRVIWGEGHDSPYSPSKGYRYDGLYLVDDYWQDRGRASFLVWRYRLVELPDRVDQVTELQSATEGIEVPSAAPRRQATVLRFVRDTKQARGIKELNDYDTADNILCLCPSHHVLFDHGGVVVAEDLSLIGVRGRLTVRPRHHLSEEHLRYRREHYLAKA